MNNNTPNFFRASTSDFKKIPGSPIAYWVSDKVCDIFQNSMQVGKEMTTREGMATSNNDLFMRFWYEVALDSISFNCSQVEDTSIKVWYPYNKGGTFRRWYGNNFHIVDWFNDGERIKNSIDTSTGRVRSHNYNGKFSFREGITWSAISSGTYSARYSPNGYLFDSKGAKGFTSDINFYLGLLNNNISNSFLKILAPTLDYKVGDIIEIPVLGRSYKQTIDNIIESLINLSKSDWDSYETSWDFEKLPLLDFRFGTPDCRLKEAYSKLRVHWKEMTLEMQKLEEENNRIFIEAYGLQDELNPDVPLKEITLTCNPYYRYGVDAEEVNSETCIVNSEEEKREFPINDELEARLLSDTMKEFIFYAVGCMFGRYSLDKPRLILANQGDTLETYLKQLPHPSFTPDKDNVIPILDGDWFTDDISERFRKFLRVTFGDKHYAENLAFIEEAIGKDIRKYFLKDFYNDHIKRYKKRPIYWMFSSPKGYFNALIYMHRYKADTISVILNDYLKEFQVKITSHRKHLETIVNSESIPDREKVKAQKEIETTIKILKDLDDYEKKILYPLATEKIEIDLDDGVKVNYQKFGEALRKIPGLDTKEE